MGFSPTSAIAKNRAAGIYRFIVDISRANLNNPFLVILNAPPITKHGRLFLVLGVYLLLGNPINKIKPLIMKTVFSPLKINEISLYNVIKIMPKLDFEVSP